MTLSAFFFHLVKVLKIIGYVVYGKVTFERLCHNGTEMLKLSNLFLRREKISFVKCDTLKSKAGNSLEYYSPYFSPPRYRCLP